MKLLVSCVNLLTAHEVLGPQRFCKNNKNLPIRTQWVFEEGLWLTSFTVRRRSFARLHETHEGYCRWKTAECGGQVGVLMMCFARQPEHFEFIRFHQHLKWFHSHFVPKSKMFLGGQNHRRRVQMCTGGCQTYTGKRAQLTNQERVHEDLITSWFSDWLAVHLGLPQQTRCSVRSAGAVSIKPAEVAL